MVLGLGVRSAAGAGSSDPWSFLGSGLRRGGGGLMMRRYTVPSGHQAMSPYATGFTRARPFDSAAMHSVYRRLVAARRWLQWLHWLHWLAALAVLAVGYAGQFMLNDRMTCDVVRWHLRPLLPADPSLPSLLRAYNPYSGPIPTDFTV